MEKDDLHYINGILNNNPRVLEDVYRRFLPAMYAMVRRNNGAFEDAKDVFQESLVIVFHHAARPGFELTAPFQSYLLGIGRFIWMRQLKKNARTEVTSVLEDGYDMEADLERQIFETEKQALYREKFEQLGQDCRQVLQRFFNREPLLAIAADMGFTGDYIKKKNKVCKEKLMELIRSDGRFKEIAQHIYPNKTETDHYGI
jgi:RNA polymerase sigma factor (sigma-70 family)